MKKSSNNNLSFLIGVIVEAIFSLKSSQIFEANHKMSKAREIIKNNKAKTGIIPSMGNWAKKFFTTAAFQGQVWGTWV